MKQLPNLGRLSLACPTGMQAGAPVATLPNDLVVRVLMLTKEGDYKAACDAAAAWGATHAAARDDDGIWLLLTNLVFVQPGLGVQTLTPADVAAGHSARKWFFELCERLSALRRAEERLKTLTRLSDERESNLPRLRQLADAARHAAMASPDNSHDRRMHRDLRLKYDEMEGYMLDTLHPGVPYDRQLPDVRVLLVAARRALRASPFDQVARRRLHRWLDRVFEPTVIPSDVQSDEDDAGVDGDAPMDEFIVEDDDSERLHEPVPDDYDTDGTASEHSLPDDI